MVEFCRTVAINIFWVLAAVSEILIVTCVILGVVDGIFKSHHPEDQE